MFEYIKNAIALATTHNANILDTDNATVIEMHNNLNYKNNLLHKIHIGYYNNNKFGLESGRCKSEIMKIVELQSEDDQLPKANTINFHNTYCNVMLQVNNTYCNSDYNVNYNVYGLRSLLHNYDLEFFKY